MKYILIIGMLFTGWQAFGSALDLVHSDKIRCIRDYYDKVNKIWYRSFGHDLYDRVDRLIEEAGGLNYVNVDDLRPRQSFTKPHRYILMRKFFKHNGIYEHYRGEVDPHAGDIKYNVVHKYIRDSGKSRYYDENPSNIQELKERKLDEYVLKSLEYFGYDISPFYEAMRPSWGRCAPEIRLLGDYRIIFLPGFYRGDNRNNVIEITQEVRWWFNDNIKPLLEDIIMLHNLEYGDYEPY